MTIEIIEKLKLKNAELTEKLTKKDAFLSLPQIQKEIDINNKRLERIEAGQSGIEQSKFILIDILSNLNKIQDKNKCARVRFLDWTASKILYYGTTLSTRIQNISNRIDSPCVIKLGDTK